mgnify:FL=1
MKNLRDYGLGEDYTSYIIGRPRLAQTITEIEDTKFDCPNCHCGAVAEIQVVMKGVPLMRSEYSTGKYLSCVACPWAGPMIVLGAPAGIPEWFEEAPR